MEYSEFTNCIVAGKKKQKHVCRPPPSPSRCLFLNAAAGISLSKGPAVSAILLASHILFYGLSVGKAGELSSLILSLESTCQDLFATGYFESDISDDPLTPADGEMLLQ